MSDNQQLPILRKENVQMIAQSAPDTYNTNQLSTQRCADFGQRLLDEIKRHGMSDDLDKRCAEFIEKAKRTVKAMNERRSPITKLFDQIRSEFTGMENQIDPSKKGTVPFLIQQERNAFATKKREAAERARQEELRKQQREQALKRYQQEAEDDFRRQFDAQITSDINSLTDINQKLSLENYEEASQKLRTFKVQLGKEWFQNIQCHAHKPYEVSDAGLFRYASQSSTHSFSNSASSTMLKWEITATPSLTRCPQRSVNWSVWQRRMQRSRSA